MAPRMRWLCLAALLPAMASAQFSSFDFGGGATSDKPWEGFHLSPKTRIRLDFHSGATWDAIIAFFENQTGVTIVKDPSLTGTTSLTSARPVPLSDAFQILSTTLSLKGFSMSKQGNLLVIKAQASRNGGGGTGFGNPGGNNGFTGGGDMGGPQAELKVYKIQYANASALARVLNDVYTQNQGGGNPFMQMGGRGFGGPGGGGGGGGQFGNRGGGQGGGFNFTPGMFGRQQPQVRASSDDFSNSVIVNAAPSDQIQVKQIIDSLDKPSDLPLQTKVYHLIYAPAQDTASIVQNVLTTNVPRGRAGATSSQTQGPQAFFNAIRGTTAGAGQVVADLRTNSIVVTAADDDIQIVDKVVEKLDHQVENQSTTFVFPLSNARAESVASILQGAFGNRQGVTAPNSSTLNNAAGAISKYSSGGNNLGSGSSTTGRTGSATSSSPLGQIQPDPSAGQYAMGYPTADQQQAMISQGQTDLPLQLADPNAQSGDLLTSIGVTQGFPGGGGGGGGIGAIFRGQGGGGSSSSSQGYTTSRLPNGQLVNTIDPTGQVTVIPDLNTNSIIVVASPETAQIVRAMLAQLDRIPQQVEIQTIIVEANLDNTSKMGVEWKFAQSLAKLGKDPTAVGTGSTGFGVQSANTTSGLPGFVYTVSSKNLSLYLSALNSDTNFQVLSTPRILTTNNVQASINVSQSIPYVTSVQTDAAGNPTYSYSFLNVGIILTIQPRIMSNGYVTLDVVQTANELQGYQSIGNTQAPIVNQREASSTVSVKDGETIILGGIMSKRVTSTVNKVPLLGDIPILGNLFKSTSKETTKTELLVFLCPHVVSNPDDAKKLTDATKKEMLPADQKGLEDIKKKGMNEAGGGGTGAKGPGGSGTGGNDSSNSKLNGG